MSDLVVDLKSGVPDETRAQQYADSFARLAKQIQDDFGVSPKQPIRTPEVIVTADAEDDTAAINQALKLNELLKMFKMIEPKLIPMLQL